MATTYGNQFAFRGRDDDVALNSTTWTYTQNNGWTQNVDETFRIRLGAEETNGKNFTGIGQIEARLYTTSWGSWFDVTTSSSILRAVASAYSIDDVAITPDQLTGSSQGSYSGGYGSEDGLATAVTINHTWNEQEYSLQILSGDVADGNLIEIRLKGLNNYAVTPQLTVSEAPALTVDDAYSTSQVDVTGALVQVHNLQNVADSYSLSQVDSPAVSQEVTLVVDDAYSTSQVDPVTVVQEITLTVDDAGCDSQVDPVVLQYGIFVLTVDDAYSESTVETIAYFPQVAKPSADVTDGAWTNELGTQTNLYESLNEDIPSDSDYIQSEFAPSNSPVVVKLESLSDPQSSSGHVLSYRLEKYPTGGETTSITIQLRQGYVNEGSLGTLIAEWVDNDLSDAMATIERTLTGPQADLITNYPDLYIRMIAD